jgi:hypothetical protein
LVEGAFWRAFGDTGDSRFAGKEIAMSDFQEAIGFRAVPPHGTGQEKIWLRRVRFSMAAGVLLSLAACANQSAVSPASEPLSVTNNPGAIGR